MVGACRRAVAQLTLQPRAEHEVVEDRTDDEEHDERGLHDQRAVEVGVERLALEAAVLLGEPEPGQDRDAHRAPPERPPAAAERPHRRRPRLALEPADRRHADEHERNGAPDPHGRGEQVDRTQDGQHARHCRRGRMTDAALAFPTPDP